MPLDSAPAVVDFIIRDHISGSFLLNYTSQIDEIISGNKCELTRRIAKVVPFWVPRRRARFTRESYCLPELVEDLDAKFSLCDPSLVAGPDEEAEEEVFVWEDESPSLSTLASDSERPNPDPAEGAGHLLSSVSVEHAGQPQLEIYPLTISLPKSSLDHDIFTSPALLQMGFLHDFPTAPASPQPAAQMSTIRTTQCLTPIKSADNDGRSSGSAPGERTSHRPEGGRRSSRTSAAVVTGCPFLCFGAGVLAPFQDLPRRLLVPRTFPFSHQLIEERRPDQVELGQSHSQ